MKNKKVIYVIIGVVFLIFIVAIVVNLLLKNHSKNNSENTNMNNIYTCAKVVLEEDDYTVYSVEKIETDNGNIVKVTKYIKTSYKTEEMYNIVKENQPSKEDGREFDNQTNSLITNKKEMKYDGEIDLKYENYKEVLITDNFKCE